MIRKYSLECMDVFLNERRTEPYKQYGEQVAQLKMYSGIKNYCGATCSAGRQTRMVSGF